MRVWASSAVVLAACTTVPLGSDPFPDAGAEDDAPMIAVDGARVPTGDVGATERPPLDPDFFFCRVQPEVLGPLRCASRSGCHATNSGLRLLVAAETDPPPTCAGDHPTSSVPASYYTNLARARAETRSTARASDLYVRPLGNGHPETLFAASSTEARILAAWIEASAP
jgi:hypothetical protein